MAMQKDLPVPGGFTAAYHRIATLTQPNGSNSTVVTVESFKDQATRQADVTAVAGSPRTATIPGYVDIAGAYAWLEAVPEGDAAPNSADFTGASEA